MRSRKFISLLAAVIVTPLLLAGRNDGKTVPTYADSIEAWFNGRIELLTAEGGYLSLVGLYSLHEGNNRFGAAEDNDLIFPEGAPAHGGTVRLQDGVATLRARGDAGIQIDGEPVRELTLIPDTQEGTTVLDMGDFHFYVIEREGQLYLRLKNPNSPARTGFKGIERFPVDPRWRFAAHFEPYDPPIRRQVPNVLGFNADVECTGAIVFEVDGKTCRLEPLEQVEDEFFVVFGDGTSGLETYGGGRFVYCPLPDADGNLFIDFNKAYNPPCAFTPYATCALPHSENQLSVRIEAGEKTFSELHE